MKNRLWLVVLLVFSFSTLLSAQPFVQSLNSGAAHWNFYLPAKKNYFPATVPGTIHTDLLQNKLIADPFYAANENDLKWIDTSTWEYSCNFDVSEQLLQQSTIELQFDGLDTYAEVFLNQKSILKADNMFCKWTVAVKPLLKAENNHLRIIFKSAVNTGKALAAAYQQQHGYTLPEGERVYVRKAQYHFGWDFAPRFVTCGIWKNVQLVAWSQVRVTDLQLHTDSIRAFSNAMIPEAYQVYASGSFNVYAEHAQLLNFQIHDPELQDGLVLLDRTQNIVAGWNTIYYQLKKKVKQLWWCNGSGEAHLQDFVFSFHDISKKITYDEIPLKTGFRTVQLIQEKDSIGTSFYFKLNNKAIYCKGANYVPMDVFLPRVKPADYRRLLLQTKAAGMNMLRVWGGGVYPDDAFFNLCDSLGILVWQDFMFACAPTPALEPLNGSAPVVTLSHVRDELTQQVIRIGNHPCLALWCGNNEIEEGWKNWGWQESLKYKAMDSAAIWTDYLQLFKSYLPQLMLQLQQNVPYVSSSPQIGWGHAESWHQGDSHYWGVWWGMEPYETYAKKVPRFASEFGMQSWPDLISVSSFLPSTAYSQQNALFIHHQKHPTGMKNLADYLQTYQLHYSDFNGYLLATQKLQANAMSYAVKAQLNSKGRCMGSLVWQLNDCWPGASWSIIDYYGRPKLAYTSLKSLFTTK